MKMLQTALVDLPILKPVLNLLGPLGWKVYKFDGNW
jgi:hypothetical protein